MASKGYVVRGKDGEGQSVWADADGENGYEPRRGGKPVEVDSADAACFAKLEIEAQDCSDVAIFRVHPDGREERLPSYEEALGDLVRLRDQHIADRAEMAGAMAEMKECARALDEAIEAHARKDAEIERLRAIEALNVGAIDASLVRLGAVTGAIGPMPADPLATLEAAERRLLEAGGWRDRDGDNRWREGTDERWCERESAVRMAAAAYRRRLVAKGGGL